MTSTRSTIRTLTPWLLGGSWAVLGGIRNIQEEDFKIAQRRSKVEERLRDAKGLEINQYNRDYMKSRIQDIQKELKEYDKPVIYVDKTLTFVCGMGTYLNPFFSLFTVPGELYRLEVNLRGLEEEKKTTRYNSIIW